MSLYQGYEPDKRNWIGWGLIVLGCIILSSFSLFNLLLFVPVIMILTGYRLAGLPFNWYSPGGGGSDSVGDIGGCDGGGD